MSNIIIQTAHSFVVQTNDKKATATKKNRAKKIAYNYNECVDGKSVM